MFTRFWFAMTLVFAAHASADRLPDGISLVGNTAHKPIAEMSGIAQSRRYPGTYWVHNDSGDDARLFAVDESGKAVIPHYVQNRFHGVQADSGKEPWPGLEVHLAVNQDWEDIAVDANHIYIADIGNNANDRRDLGIYLMVEPNPYERLSARTLKYLPIRYPEQESYPPEIWHYDAESIFVSDDTLYFVTKHRQPGKLHEFEQGANLYRLDDPKTDEVNVLTRVDSHPRLTVISGADMSADGTQLAVVGPVGVWVFDKPKGGDKWFSSTPRGTMLNHGATRQLEAVTWKDEGTLLITNEQRDIYAVDVSKLPRQDPPRIRQR